MATDTQNTRVLLFYPPGKLYQRGEDRSQGNIEDSTSTALRAPNDLCYAAADLKRRGFHPIVRDYQGTRATPDDLFRDVAEHRPGAIFLSVTNATIFSDLEYVAAIKTMAPDCMVMLKGALFFDPGDHLLEQLDLTHVDYLIGMESDFTVGRLVAAHFGQGEDNPGDIPGILYKKDAVWTKTSFSHWQTNLDDFPFPDRTCIDNSLYARPDTNEPQATIVTSRGCPAQCTYCLTPRISGTRLRVRSPANIIAEMEECYHQHHIRNFFFKSDTFTLEPGWVRELCQGILASPLRHNIQWVANSRTRPLQRESLAIMREAGCWLVAFGYESGHPETLKAIRKGTEVDDNIQASRWAREAGLQTFGFFMMGFPWENWEHLEATRRHMLELDSDFVELHLAIPYYGTALHQQAVQAGTASATILGSDYFNPPLTGTRHLSLPDLVAFRKKVLLRYHLRPRYIARKIAAQIGNPRVIWNYGKFGIRLLKSSVRR